MPPYPRNGLWYSDFRAIDPETGRPRRYRQSLGPEVRSKKEAEAAERRRRLQHQVENAGEPAPAVAPRPEMPAASAAHAELPSAPFSGLAHRWLTVAIAPKRKAKTYQLPETSKSCRRVRIRQTFRTGARQTFRTPQLGSDVVITGIGPS